MVHLKFPIHLITNSNVLQFTYQRVKDFPFQLRTEKTFVEVKEGKSRELGIRD